MTAVHSRSNEYSCFEYNWNTGNMQVRDADRLGVLVGRSK